jgi:hypothetical protein
MAVRFTNWISVKLIMVKMIKENLGAYLKPQLHSLVIINKYD